MKCIFRRKRGEEHQFVFMQKADGHAICAPEWFISVVIVSVLFFVLMFDFQGHGLILIISLIGIFGTTEFLHQRMKLEPWSPSE